MNNSVPFEAAHMVLAFGPDLIRTTWDSRGDWHGLGLGLQRPTRGKKEKKKDLEVFVLWTEGNKRRFIYAVALNSSIRVGLGCHGAEEDDFLLVF